MPINKFGSHFLNDSCPSANTNLSSTFYICEPTSFHSKCFVRLRGIKKENRNREYYILDNDGVAFVFAIDGVIESVRHYAADGEVVINSKPYKYHHLTGVEIKNGDKIEFKLGTPDQMCADFVIQCPIVRNV